MKRLIHDQLIQWKNNPQRKPLLLLGARQIGKTYSLKEFGITAFPQMHYLNFEEHPELKDIFLPNLDPARILQEIEFFLDTSINIETDLLVLDEIQHCGEALTSLKYFYENMPDLACCGAGSLLGINFSDSPFPVGKVTILDMYPMSFKEFLLAAGDKGYAVLENFDLETGIPEMVHKHLWNRLKQYFIVGGLPEAVRTYLEYQDDFYEATKHVRSVQYDLQIAYLADMAKHAGKQNSMHLTRVWENVPAQLGHQQDGSATRYRIKGVIPGVKEYSRLAGTIDWLKTAGLVLQVPIANRAGLPFRGYTKENEFKLYMFDVGMLGSLARIQPSVLWDYDYGSYKGFFAENFVAQEFRSSGVTDLISWKENTAEVEFLLEHQGQIIPVEVKSGWRTQAKSLKSFGDKYDPPVRIILSARNMELKLDKGIWKIPLYLASELPSLLESQ